MFTALLIDDEPLTTQALRKVIEENFPAIEILAETTNGMKAWDLIMKQRPDFIISDIRMPDLNGLQLIEKIREAQLPMKVILLTAFGEFEYAKKAIQLGASSYLLKPFIQTELIHEVFQLIQKLEEENEVRGLKNKVSKVIPIIEESALKKLLANKMDAVMLKDFLEVVGNKWEQCYVCVYQVDLSSSTIKEIEEVVKISIIEEINNYILENDFHGISFFRKFNEIVLAFNRPDSLFPTLEIDSTFIQGCIQILTKYLDKPLSVGSSQRQYALEQLPEAYDYAIKQMISLNERTLETITLETTTPVHQDQLISKAIDFCEQNYAKDISLQKASDHLNMNKFYFCSLFKEKLNVTFWDYITQMRIAQAKELLKTTREKINNIAVQIGYINSSHFGRIFKETTGVTPAEYRRRNQ